MGTEMVPEMSVLFDQLTRMLAQEDFLTSAVLKTSSSYVAPYTKLDNINNTVIRKEFGNFNWKV
jgi:hypothetical protein